MAKTAAKTHARGSKQPKPKFHEILAQNIIEQIKNGVAPWQKPWSPGVSELPYNAVTGKPYRGANVMMLAMRGDADPRYVTYYQAQEQGWQVKQGSHGIILQRWVFDKEETAKDANGKPIFDEKGKPVKVRVELENPFPVSFVVFNAADVEGMPPLEKGEALSEFQANERADNIVAALKVPVKYDSNDKCYYAPARDEIHLVPKERFKSPQDHYKVLFHEEAHATGHESRLNRPTLTATVSSLQDRAREEMRAQIAAWMLGMEIGIHLGEYNKIGEDDAAYVESWVSALQDTPLEIVNACKDADKIKSYVLEREREYLKEQEKAADMDEAILDEQCGAAETKPQGKGEEEPEREPAREDVAGLAR